MSNIKITIEGVEKEYEAIAERYPKYADINLFGIYYREVEPKQDYEIQSFSDYGKRLWDLRSDGKYRCIGDTTAYSLLEQIEHVKTNTITINSVKRLSDGEVFSVGEQIIDFGTISKFIISDFNEMILQNTEFGGYRIFESAVKVKQPTILLTTEDGVEITDVYQSVNGLTIEFIKFKCNAPYTNQPKESKYYNSKYFSTAAARDEYIHYNKPISISLRELLDNPLDPIAFFKSKQK